MLLGTCLCAWSQRRGIWGVGTTTPWAIVLDGRVVELVLQVFDLLILDLDEVHQNLLLIGTQPLVFVWCLVLCCRGRL